MYPLIVHAGDVKKITITHMIGSLQVLGTGLFFSFLVLLLELVYWASYLLPRRRQEVLKQLAAMAGRNSSTSQATAGAFLLSLSPAEQQLLLSSTMAGTGFLGWLRNYFNPNRKRRVGSSSDRQRFLPEQIRLTGSGVGFAARTGSTQAGMGGLERPWNTGVGYQGMANVYSGDSANAAAAPITPTTTGIPSQLTYRAKMHPNLYGGQYLHGQSSLARDYNQFNKGQM